MPADLWRHSRSNPIRTPAIKAATSLRASSAWPCTTLPSTTVWC